MLDRYGRRIDHLRLSVTDRCGLRCFYCMPDGDAPRVSRDEILSFEEIAGIVGRLRERFGLSRVRITGGEPLLRPHLAQLVELLHRLGLDEIAMTTNGQTLARSAGALADAGLRRVNISLDSLDPERYRRLTGGVLSRTLDGIETASAAGLRPLKINTVVLRGWNETEVESLTEWALTRGHEIRFLELMAIGYAQGSHPELFVSSKEVRARLGRAFRLQPIDGEPGAPARSWRASKDRLEGRIGFISSESEPFCASCRRLRLTAKGKLLGCLMHNDGIDLRAAWTDGGGLDGSVFDAAVLSAIGMKPENRVRVSAGHMVEIGG